MKIIYKFPLVVTDWQSISIKGLVEILTVQVQHGQPQLWALVDLADDAPTTAVQIVTLGTGHPVETVGKYLGTYQLNGGQLVLHVFVGGGAL